MTIKPEGDWILRICAGVITFILCYGVLVAGWLRMPNKIESVETGVKELLELRAHRIFTVVPEKREIRVSTNPRLLEVEIPPHAVKAPVTFEFNQNPIIPLPVPLSEGYTFLGWAVVFGPETVEFIEPFTAKVELEPEERDLRKRLGLLRWSKDEMRWHEVPTDIEQDRLTGKYLLNFKTKDTGLFALSLKDIPLFLKDIE